MHPTQMAADYGLEVATSSVDDDREQDTVIRKGRQHHDPIPGPLPSVTGPDRSDQVLGPLGHRPLVWSNRTRFVNGHDGGGAGLLRVMIESHEAEAGNQANTTLADLGRFGEAEPVDTSVRVICVRADAMGAKVAMRAAAAESRLVVIAAQLDGIGHPRVPHAARFTFRQINKNLCPVVFIPFETRWRSDLKAKPGKRYRRDIAKLAQTIDNTRNSAAGMQPQPA